MVMFIRNWREKAHALKVQVYAVYLASRDPRVPLPAKIVAALVAGYAFSPLDLIPDFIPVLGFVDDLIVVPLGMAWALKMIPAEVLADCRARASKELEQEKPVNRLAAIVIIAIWLVGAVLAVRFVAGLIK